jgi:hypothetical protein
LKPYWFSRSKVKVTVKFLLRNILVYTRINILQWILTKLGTYLVPKRIWNPIDFQDHMSKIKVTGSNIYRTPSLWTLESTSFNGFLTKLGTYLVLKIIRVITKLPNPEQSYKGRVKAHNYINRQNQSPLAENGNMFFNRSSDKITVLTMLLMIITHYIMYCDYSSVKCIPYVRWHHRQQYFRTVESRRN